MDLETYDFADHLDSIAWIERLPSGLVQPSIDLRYNTVTLTTKQHGYDLYIGPRNIELGGDGILIRLDHQVKLIDYEIERIEPTP